MGGSVAAFFALVVLVVEAHHYYEFHYGFDRLDWQAPGAAIRQDTADMGGVSTGNRESMVEDLMAHHLSPGMTRAQVVALLGPPERDGIEWVVPDSVALPDSLDWSHMSDEAVLKQGTEGFTKWHHQHAQPDTIIRYRVGWDMIDPTSLHVELNGKGRVKRYWVAIH